MTKTWRNVAVVLCVLVHLLFPFTEAGRGHPARAGVLDTLTVDITYKGSARLDSILFTSLAEMFDPCPREAPLSKSGPPVESAKTFL